MFKDVLKSIIYIYQKVISPLKKPSCRFYPSCSHYALESLEKWPIHRAIILTTKRFLRCHPFNAGGFDPVPEKRT